MDRSLVPVLISGFPSEENRATDWLRQFLHQRRTINRRIAIPASAERVMRPVIHIAPGKLTPALCFRQMENSGCGQNGLLANRGLLARAQLLGARTSGPRYQHRPA